MSSTRITSVHFKKYKAFENFSISLQDFNVLVGPNNAGKSSVLRALSLMQTSDVGLGEVNRVLGAIAKGDLTERITADYEKRFAR